MTSILDNFTELLGGDVVNQVSKTLGISPDILKQGLAIAGPLIAGAIAKMTNSSSGMNSFTNVLNQTQSIPVTGTGDNLSSFMGSLNQGQGSTGADMMQSLLGNGVNAIGGTLSQKLGFNMRPILAMATPLVIGAINKTMKTENLDANGVAQRLQQESQQWKNDPANSQTASLIQEAVDAGQKGEEVRNMFTDAEWEKVRMAPVAATYLVGAASPSQGGGALKELSAAVTSVEETLDNTSPTSVIGTAFGGGFTSAELEALKSAKPTTESVLRTISEARAIVASKSPEDARDYTNMVMNVATNVANATKEGGFLGIGGQQVTKEEQDSLDAIKRALNS